jgi:hypothetical protein
VVYLNADAAKERLAGFVALRRYRDGVEENEGLKKKVGRALGRETKPLSSDIGEDTRKGLEV